MIDPVDRAVRAVVRWNPYALVWAQFGLAHVVMLGGLGLLVLYQPMSTQDFLILLAVSQGLVLIDNLVSVKLTRRMWRPVRRWEDGARDEASTIAAWTALATLPINYLRRTRTYPFVLGYLPFIAFTTWLLELPWYSFPLLAVVGTVVLTYALIVRYFTMEVVVRPVLEEVASGLPPDFEIDAASLPLRWRLLAVAPAINVITGVVVAGLSTHGHHATLDDLGVSWAIAVGVSFTISLELVVLVARSLASSLADLQRATERVVREGADLAGEHLEVSVMFLDVRDFTAFAERSAPTEVVALLNDLWALVVPALLRHGGHANKFIGDGLLAVFGAPDPQPDHAERAVAAALDIAQCVRQQYDGRIAVGIGVNSGPVVAGTVGGGGRVEFTVIGDAVNTAARVEAATRETGDDVLITDATRGLLTRRRFGLLERGTVPMKGKQTEVRLWAPKAQHQRPSATPAAARGGAGAATASD
jgi:class 3 adenylate cyclase